MAAGTNRLPPVSQESYEGWWDFAYGNGADIATLAEVIGIELARLAGSPLSTAPPFLRRSAMEAARLKRERSRRR